MSPTRAALALVLTLTLSPAARAEPFLETGQELCTQNIAEMLRAIDTYDWAGPGGNRAAAGAWHLRHIQPFLGEACAVTTHVYRYRPVLVEAWPVAPDADPAAWIERSVKNLELSYTSGTDVTWEGEAAHEWVLQERWRVLLLEGGEGARVIFMRVEDPLVPEFRSLNPNLHVVDSSASASGGNLSVTLTLRNDSTATITGTYPVQVAGWTDAAAEEKAWTQFEEILAAGKAEGFDAVEAQSYLRQKLLLTPGLPDHLQVLQSPALNLAPGATVQVKLSGKAPAGRSGAVRCSVDVLLPAP